MTKYIKCGGGGLPPQVITDMNAVLNKKFSTSTTYPSSEWADMIEEMTALPEESASGSIAHFEDGADTVPLDTGLFYFNPVQASGTPTPSSPIPITGHTGLNITRAGKNLFDKTNFNSIDGYFVSPNFVITSNASHKIVYIPCNPNTTYTASRTRTSGNERLAIGYTNELPAVGVTVSGNSRAADAGTVGDLMSVSTTTGANAKYIVVWAWWSSSDEQTAKDELQIEQSATATAYEAYVGTTYPISWTSHGTIYGGYYDSKTGELWKTQERMVLNGSENWGAYSNRSGFYLNITDMATSTAYDGYCDKLKVSASWMEQLGIRFGQANSYIYVLQITNNISDVTDVPSWKSYLEDNNITIVYPLTTPVLVGIIDPTKITTYEGVNNIWNDGGGVSDVGYRADIDLYVAEHS